MIALASRRSILCGLTTLPMAGGSAVLASQSASEAAFLALAPTIVPMLDEADRLWVIAQSLYAAWEEARDKRPLRDRVRRGWEETDPAWLAYSAAYRAPNDLFELVANLVEPHLEIPAETLPALMLKRRIGRSIDAYEDDVLADLDRMWEARPCA